MNTLYFKYAVEIEKAGSITQAAQNLYMAQPNLSKAIKDLEDDLGYAIFSRSASGIRVTEKGNAFLYHAHKMLEQLEEMEKIGVAEEEDRVRYKVAFPRGSYIANGFTEFVAKWPDDMGMQITVNETNTLKTIDYVADCGYNMGIIRYQALFRDYYEKLLKGNHLDYEKVWEFPYVLIMSRNHPLAKKEQIQAEDLGGYVQIAHGDLETPRRERGKSRERVIYVYERGSQFDLLTHVPSTYMWVSPLPETYLEQYHLVQRKCEVPDNLYCDTLIYRKDYKLGEKDQLFREMLFQSKRNVAGTWDI